MSRFDRASALDRLATEHFDVLVIGGGITGAGVALDAASRGLRTALVEKGDFASGTSSRSSKLVHGGLRYLRRGELSVVRESLAERELLLENAPHLVRPLPFVVPVFGGGRGHSSRAARSLAAGLHLYDLAGGRRIAGRHRRIGAQETLDHLPSLRADGLAGAFSYHDARTDDARLTLAVLRTAVLDHGAVAANYAAVTSLAVDAQGQVVGARVSPAIMPGISGSLGDAAGGPDFDVWARVVVNATGAWADDVRSLLPGEQPRILRPAKGIHVTVPRHRLPCGAATVLPADADGRSVFAIPWDGAELTYVGTTDTDYDGPLEEPPCTPEDVAYLLDAVNAVTTAGLTPEDVTAVWAGVRPLLAAGAGRRRPQRTADLSRRHLVRTSPSGLVTVTGGKLTTYRRMAADATDEALAVLGDRDQVRPRTAHLRLHGAPDDVPPDAGRLDERYGTEAPALRSLAAADPGLAHPIVAGLPYTGVEVLFAVREEMAQSLDDVLSRRTRAVSMDARAAADAAPAVARMLAGELGWSDEQAAAHTERFRARLLEALEVAGLPTASGAPR